MKLLLHKHAFVTEEELGQALNPIKHRHQLTTAQWIQWLKDNRSEARGVG